MNKYERAMMLSTNGMNGAVPETKAERIAKAMTEAAVDVLRKSYMIGEVNLGEDTPMDVVYAACSLWVSELAHPTSSTSPVLERRLRSRKRDDDDEIDRESKDVSRQQDDHSGGR